MPNNLRFPSLPERSKPPSPVLRPRADSLTELGRESVASIRSSCWRSNLAQSAFEQPSPASGSSSGATPWSSEPDPCQFNLRKVCVSDAELVRRACAASQLSRDGRMVRVSSSTWSCKEIEGFALLSRRIGDELEGLEVLTTGEVACQPSELVSLLCPATESDYNAVVRGLLNDQFIYGSFVHDIAPPEAEEYQYEEPALLPNQRLAVKTACFSRSRVFARNEQWCFLEHLQPRGATTSDTFLRTQTSSAAPDVGSGFTLVMSSLPEHELCVGKSARGHVAQLHGITATYLVEPLLPTSSCIEPRVRVTFHATFKAEKSVPRGYADSQTVRTRLLAIAKGVNRLSALVRWRRRECQLSRQDSRSGSCSPTTPRASQSEMQNSHCIGCTKRLRLRLLATPTRKTTRCELCSYNVCASCWSWESVATFSGHAATMAVCRRCHESVSSSEYSHIALARPEEMAKERSRRKRWARTARKLFGGQSDAKYDHKDAEPTSVTQAESYGQYGREHTNAQFAP